MMIIYKYQWLFLLVLLSLSACTDPLTTTAPADPRLAHGIIPGEADATDRLLELLEAQLALSVNTLFPLAEIASDNYQNTQAYYNQALDKLDITPNDLDTERGHKEIARLLALARYGRDVVWPVDTEADDNERAEFNFYLGTALIFAGQYYKSLPAETNGLPVPARQNLILAEEAFRQGQALAEAEETKVACLLGWARAQYLLGERSGAVAAAQEAIDLAPNFVRYVHFSTLEQRPNVLQDALHDRANTDDLQPLPRLDFLDPKYHNDSGTQDMPIALFKIEEALLIQCEADISAEDLAAAQQKMSWLLELLAQRPLSILDDSKEERTQREPGSRPNHHTIQVASLEGAIPQPSLVLSRHEGQIAIPSVSGTSVDQARIDTLENLEEALALLYLLRQEIFIAEGQRMSDLGIKFVLSTQEQMLNPLVDEEDLTPRLPPFLEMIDKEIDAFTYDIGSGLCTITHDLNAIIVRNKDSEFVAPFHN